MVEVSTTTPAAATGTPLDGARCDARQAVLQLLSSTGFDTGVPDHRDGNDAADDSDDNTVQIQLCGRLLDALQKVQQEQEASAGKGKFASLGHATNADDGENLAPSQQNANSDFIRTNIDYNNKQSNSISASSSAQSPTKAGVRDALVNLPSSAMSNLPAVLSQLLTDRVDAAALLPATQDVQANLEAMGLAGDPAKKSMTISRLGLLAGRVYAELIAMPGAWGAGLIDAAAVSALSALVRRWSVECRGREPGAGDDDDDEGGANSNHRKGKGKKNARKRGGQGDAGANASKRGRKGGGPRKRKGVKARGGAGGGGKKTKTTTSESLRRSARSVVVAKLSDSEADSDDESDFDEEEDRSDIEDKDEAEQDVDIMEASTANPNADNNTHSEQEMVMGGLRLALSIAKVPVLKEFINWSSEAKEAILDAVTVAMACASALLASPSIAEGDGEMRSLCNGAVKSLSHALQTCVVIRDDATAATVAMAKTPSRSANRGGGATTAAAAADAEKAMETSQETAVFVLRGLLPLLSLHVELPMGQKGKLNAHDAATDVLEGIIGSVSDDIEKYDSIVRAASRPRRTPRVRGGSVGGGDDAPMTPGAAGSKTPRTEHKSRRKSVGLLSPVPPSLKKTVTPSKSRAYTPAQPDAEEEGSAKKKPRPILSTMLGLMQKLATAKGLERAQVRARASSIIKRCLPRFPSLEQSYFLRFITQLCHSKVAFHRLFAVELVGEFLSDDWIWKHYNTAVRVSSPGVRDTSTMSPALREIMTEPSIPVALLKALHDRLSDRAPAVRARAAHSLSDALARITKVDSEGKASDESFVLSDDEMEDFEKDQADEAKPFKEAVLKLAPQLISTLRKRAACDERATVRKASIAGLTSMLLVMDGESTSCLAQTCPSQSDVVIFCRLCGDQSVATRKAAAEALATLVKNQYSKGGVSLLDSAFAEAVLPLVLDAETTCVSKAVDLFCEIVLDPIIEVGGRTTAWNSDFQKNRYMTAWRVLARISEASNESGASKGGTRALKVALTKVFDDAGASHGNVSKPLLKEVHRVAVSSLELEGSSSDDTEDMNETLTDNSSLFNSNVESQRVGAWCLLDALTDCGPQKKGTQQSGRFDPIKAFKSSSCDSEFLASSWEKLHQMSSSPDISQQSLSTTIITSRQCLQVMSRLGSMVGVSAASHSAASLKNLLSSFDLPNDLIGSGISALIALSKRICDDKDSKADKDVHDACAQWIAELYSSCEATLESFVKKTGQGLTYESSEIERAIFTVGELSLVGFATDEDASNVKSKKDESNEDPVRGLRVRPSSRLINLIQLVLPSHLPPVDGATPSPTPQTARALGFVSLGKLCLRDERLAKECLNILARELNQETDINDPSVQSNVLLVLGDLCIKYTNLVDKFLPVMVSILIIWPIRKASGLLFV